MSAYNKTALAKAVAYLRSRGKYIMDKSCTFKPTGAAATDVRATWEAYHRERGTNMRRVK
jgi:hypothetical protein